MKWLSGGLAGVGLISLLGLAGCGDDGVGANNTGCLAEVIFSNDPEVPVGTVRVLTNDDCDKARVDEEGRTTVAGETDSGGGVVVFEITGTSGFGG